ncbi:MAG: aminotransferase class V-fold PLP-dependent enzyme [Caulobacteraceae bacterium]|nr:aminotransferase class V-fold PLP-dependent enzyme [Caulobacteraceae bacterium]
MNRSAPASAASRPGRFPGLPEDGSSEAVVGQAVAALAAEDEAVLASVRFGRRFYPGADVARVAAQAYGAFAQAGRASLYPGLPSPQSVATMTRDLISASLALFGAPADGIAIPTSGGTESAILVARAALRRTRSRRSGASDGPAEVIAPWSAHPCIDKAAELLGFKLIRTPLGADLTADLAAMAAAITPRTAMLYASFPSYPFGLPDDVAALSDLAVEHDLWLHVDASMGGYLAPFLRLNGEAVPDFDFALPGVSSIAADLHKHGYGAKGVAMLLVRSPACAPDLDFTFADFPLPPMKTSTLAGTAAGAPLAAAWAVFQYLGVKGYCALAARLSASRRAFVEAIGSVPGFCVLGEPLFSIVSFATERGEAHDLVDALIARDWFVLPTHGPAGVQMNLSLTDGDLAPRLAEDLRAWAERLS